MHQRTVWLLSVLPAGFEQELYGLMSAVALQPDYLGHIATLLGYVSNDEW